MASARGVDPLRTVGAAAALVLAALLLAPAALAQPVHHEDHTRVLESEEAILAAAVGALTESERAYAALMGNETPLAREAGLSADALGADLATAAERPLRKVEIIEALHRHAPPAERLGASTLALVDAYTTLKSEDRPLAVRLFARADALDAISGALAALDGYDANGFATAGARESLATLQRVVLGTSVSPLAEEHELALDKAEAVFGEVVRAVLLDARYPGTAATIEAFGQVHSATLSDAGLAVVVFAVPWTAEVGLATVAANWTGGTANASLLVKRVETRWREVAVSDAGGAGGAGGARAFAGRLVDGYAVAVHPALVVWEAPGASGSAATDSTGRVNFTFGTTKTLRVVYDGNRTHDAASYAYREPVMAPLDELKAQFRQVGWSGPPSKPEVPWALILLLFATVVAAGVGEAALATREPSAVAVPAPAGAAAAGASTAPAAPAALASPRAPAGAMLPGHPLLLVLQREGHATAGLTMRESARLWKALGAPAVDAWARAHERALYTGRPLPVVPAELMAWATARAGAA